MAKPLVIALIGESPSQLEIPFLLFRNFHFNDESIEQRAKCNTFVRFLYKLAPEQRPDARKRGQGTSLP